PLPEETSPVFSPICSGEHDRERSQYKTLYGIGFLGNHRVPLFQRGFRTMWTTLTLIAALHSALGQADQLQLTHVRSPYSLFGVERKDNKLLPGDVFIVMFNIEGLKEDKNGKFLFQMGMKMTDAKGKLKYGEEPEGREAISLFGGRSVPSF